MASSDLIASHSARLSYNDFETAIKAFQRQTKHHAPWSYVEYRPRRDQPLQGYLSMTHLIHSNKHSGPAEEVSSNSNLSAADQLLLDDLAEHFGEIPDEETEDPAVSETISYDFLSVSYHILFSPSYQVPVLYFNAYRPDGAAISLNEIYESLVPEEWRSSIRNAGLNGGISQQDHPILNVPYFYMHPCETVPLMETVQNNQSFENASSFLDSYIMTWLSFTGQAIGITIPTGVVVGAI